MLSSEARVVSCPFRRDAQGKPVIPATAEAIYAFGDLIRRTETLLLQLFSRGLLSGTTHTCLGQELCQMAVVRALDHPDDAIFSNHRNHGHFLTYSGDFFGLVSEIMGRSAGTCGGIGGSQHLAYRNFHSNGVQGGMTAMAVGQAMARRARGSDGIVAVVVGDGTTGQGLLYESLNLGAVLDCPMLFVIENNGVAQTTPTRLTVAGSLEGRGTAFGLETWRLDDADTAFFDDVEQIVATVRRSRKPGLLVIDTQRLGPHSKGDDLRDEEEMRVIRDRDPLARLHDRLDSAARDEILRKNEGFIRAVEEAAVASPEACYSEPPQHIFSSVPRTVTAAPPSGNVRSELNNALGRLLDTQPAVILLGEDLHDPYGGAFKVTAGLSTRFPGRVLSTPISEAGVVGAAIGLALDGFLPIVEVMFADFLTLAMDQIFNHAVKFPGMFPECQVPLVIRTPSGGRRGYGPTHSQSPENLACGIPGLTVVYPSHRHAVGSLLESAVIDWPHPVVFFEHKLLYGTECTAADYHALPADPLDPAADRFPTMCAGPEPPDVTFVTYGGMVTVVEAFVQSLADEEITAEIVVPSLLSPLPKRTLLRHLLNRPRVIVAEEATGQSGFGAELAATLLEAGFAGRLSRVNAPPVPIPAARSLEIEVLPGEPHLMQAVLSVLGLSGDFAHAEAHQDPTNQ
jgi:2-oxoisovalerate dehydrogenase E1 component